MRKIFLIALLSILFLIALPASALTQTEIQALILQLQNQIAQLQAQLQALIGQQSAGPWCHTFSSNLGYANSGSSEVAYLHTALSKQGFSYAPDIGAIYGEGTVLAVKKFQEKYISDVLLPYGLSRGTGYVGKTTRAKLNQFYGCTQATEPIACTMDAKQCPDGSYVGRTGPNCEFAPCPTSSSNTCVPTWQCSNWSTCSNNTQTRTCSDLNTCGVNTEKPTTTQECNTEVSGCTDSDSGINIYAKGTTCVGEYCETDYCKYDATVTEFYCTVTNNKGMIGWEYMPCARGVCAGGVCVSGGSNCKNECISGSSYCTTELYSSTGKIYLKQCGDYDDDPCSEWGQPTLCSGDTSCGYGKCPDYMKSVWYCNSNIGQGACDYSCVESPSCCVAKTCSELVCGVHDDGCGQTIDCGSCNATCSSLGKSCGKWNYSGTQVSCGACPTGQYCQDGQCLASSITSCIDSEQDIPASLQVFIMGSVITPSFPLEPAHDECILPQNNLVDVFCKNGILETVESSCGDCKQGICVPGAYEINRSYCSNKATGGAEFIYGNNVYDLDNYCVDNNLVKYTCQNYSYSGLSFNWLKTEIISCENGCLNSVCISPYNP